MRGIGFVTAFRQSVLSSLGFAVVWCVLGSGCTIIRQNYDASVPEIAQYQAGQTHYRDVLDDLGPPAKLSALGEGMVFLYEEAELLERQLGINIHFRDVPILKFVVGRGSAERQAMALVFDDTGLLRGARRDSWNQDLGGGASAQLVGAVVPVTDSGGLDESPAVHDWGAMLLQPNLPIALNRQSSLLTGQNGVQQFGTPLTAGQHSLELRTSSGHR